MAVPAIQLSPQGSRHSSATEYLARASRSHDPPAQESELLKAICLALRGAGTDLISSVHSSCSSIFADDPFDEEELTWNAETVIISTGGVMKKKWSFHEEMQPVQWACIGWLDQSGPTFSASQYSAAHYTSEDRPVESKSPSDRPTFGPFARNEQGKEPTINQDIRVPAVFVFLRSIGRIFLKNGLDYTFSLPFIVRKAWPLYPHGVLVQRVLEPTELVEAQITGDAPLPTIFSVTSPFAEAAAVGLTSGITGGFGTSQAVLRDEDENMTKPLKSMPPTEMVVWTSHRGPEADDDILVTIDVDKRRLTIWRYAYVKPKDTPVPLDRNNGKGMHRKRQSVGNRRTSGVYGDMVERRERMNPLSPTIPARVKSPPLDFPDILDMPPLSSLPGRAPSLSTTTTMASLVSSGSQWSAPPKARRNSLSRNELSVTMDRMVLGGRADPDVTLAPIEHGRMRASYWVEKLYSIEVSNDDALAWRRMSASLFDHRWDGQEERSLMAVCLPSSATLIILSLAADKHQSLTATHLSSIPAISCISLRVTRDKIWDLLVVKPDHQLVVLTHGTFELPVAVCRNLEGENPMMASSNVITVRNSNQSSVSLEFADGQKSRMSLDLVSQDVLTTQCLRALSFILPTDVSFDLHHRFLYNWSTMGFRSTDNIEFNAFSSALFTVLDLGESLSAPSPSNPWEALAQSPSFQHFRDDPVFKHLKTPSQAKATDPELTPGKPHYLLAPVLYALHIVGEDLRLLVQRYEAVLRLASVICRIAMVIRPEWCDFWKRLCPEATLAWPNSLYRNNEYLDDRIASWPPDVSAILYGRIGDPEWVAPLYVIQDMAAEFQITPSLEYGQIEPLLAIPHLTSIYKCLANKEHENQQKRAEEAIEYMIKARAEVGSDFFESLPLGIAAPIREAARLCQLTPPADWSSEIYEEIGRNDLAARVNEVSDMLFSNGYMTVKDYISPSRPRKTISDYVLEARTLAGGEVDATSGVELDLEDFTSVRFGQDRRLEEVARLLCSSTIPNIKLAERPELSEHDQAKEHQLQVVRIAERTLALPYGRAMFTFGSVPIVTREAYAVPKLEYTIRIQPLNIAVSPEPGKLQTDSLNWGEFHNGVAAGLRISASSTGVESSWIAFNKPSELNPEHAGFLFGLGLTGHLREMLTWHTFAYLTPKHDLTSIGVLLGLSAANVGTGNHHVTKLLAVHTPALLPTPNVDLNVSLMTQAAGLAGVGLLYLGTKNRRMAEVCLNQISRRDLVQPDLSNEHREAYTYAAALAFGMVMLGKGSSVPADMALLSRLSVLVHGDANSLLGHKSRPHFDINLTSPAATIGLGLMYLRTERQDVADILTIPDTILALNRIQPNFLLMRTLARALIMWNAIAPTNDWLSGQIPKSIAKAMEARFQGKTIDDALELAYYNIVAGCCFAIGLKYAGTARQEAYLMIISYFDLYSRLVLMNGPAFEHKIKRSAVRDGLNLISISLSMVMAGTGEITCLRRFRYAYGMYHQAFKYGIHVATHMSLGLLFLGGGRFTLGTSDAAIASMVAAFFPRSHHISSDNKSYLQALRHLWVLAVEPRCLVARDVDTTEVVYLPVKITIKEGNEVGTTQLISPTLIPDLDKLVSIRVDTPRYWPFFLDIENNPRHKESLLRCQTLYVKRRTAFLSYTEDPRGSRSLFVRSGSSSGDAAILDFPQLTDAQTHPASDLSEFITSFSNDIRFLSFADHFSREYGETDNERLFLMYCHAALLDSILQDKPQVLQSHLTLYQYRMMDPSSRFFHLRIQDLRFAADFYGKMYERRFGARTGQAPRSPLIRGGTVGGALLALDRKLDEVRKSERFVQALRQYAKGEAVDVDVDTAGAESGPSISVCLAWYLLRHCVPVYSFLVILRDLARDAHEQCLGRPPPQGTDDVGMLDLGIREVLHTTGAKMAVAFGSGWSAQSLEDIIEAWKVL